MIRQRFFFFGFASAILLLANLFYPSPDRLGPGLILYLVGGSRCLGKCLPGKYFHPGTMLLWLSSSCLPALMLLNTISYYSYGVTTITSALVLFLPLNTF